MRNFYVIAAMSILDFYITIWSCIFGFPPNFQLIFNIFPFLAQRPILLISSLFTVISYNNYNTFLLIWQIKIPVGLQRNMCYYGLKQTKHWLCIQHEMNEMGFNFIGLFFSHKMFKYFNLTFSKSHSDSYTYIVKCRSRVICFHIHTCRWNQYGNSLVVLIMYACHGRYCDLRNTKCHIHSLTTYLHILCIKFVF